ncbi:hypothetical protein GCM10010266_01830 [Streptomyces griseomycini]|nr:hypothetical protein GCM10010266_01830 [Streptomyces griseomycini]
MHHLEREDAVETGVHGPVDRGHPADRDPRLDAIPAVEHLPDQRVLKGRVHAGEFTSRRDGPDRFDPVRSATAADL